MEITLLKKTALIVSFLVGYCSIQASQISFQTDPKRIESLKQYTDTLIQYIENIKSEVKYLTLNKHEVLDDYFFKQKEGELLKLKIENYKRLIISNFSGILKPEELNQLLPTDVKNKQHFYSWEDEYFRHISQEPALAILTVIQIWVTNTKDTIIERIK